MFFTSGFIIGRFALFQIRNDHHKEMLSESIRAGRAPHGGGYIDPGPPTRDAFFWQRSTIDKWVGVVYDPTGSVMQVNQSESWDDRHDPTWSAAANPFGSTLYKCEKMQGHGYLCWFT